MVKGDLNMRELTEQEIGWVGGGTPAPQAKMTGEVVAALAEAAYESRVGMAIRKRLNKLF